MPPLVVVTGATGKVGTSLIDRLVKHGLRIRAIARNAEKLKPLAARGVEVHAGNLEDTPFLTGAFRGADAVFAVIPDHLDASDFRETQRQISASVATSLQTAGVPRVVLLSSVGADVPSADQ